MFSNSVNIKTLAIKSVDVKTIDYSESAWTKNEAHSEHKHFPFFCVSFEEIIATIGMKCVNITFEHLK